MNETPETESLKLDLDRRKLGPLTKLDVYDELARKLEVERDEARRELHRLVALLQEQLEVRERASRNSFLNSWGKNP